MAGAGARATTGARARTRAGQNRRGSEDVEDDASNRGAGENASADPGAHAPQGPVVAAAGHRRHPADHLGPVRDRARLHGPLLLGTGLPLPDAVLLAVHQRRVRARVQQPRPVVPGRAADHPLRAGVAAVRARLPAELLLLPAGLLPRVLAGAGRVRPAGAPTAVLPRD